MIKKYIIFILLVTIFGCENNSVIKKPKINKNNSVNNNSNTVPITEEPVLPPLPTMPPPLPITPIPIIPIIPIEPDVSCKDSDADGICNRDDVCANFDDKIDIDQDGTPQGCDCDDNDPTVYPGTNCLDSNEEDCIESICATNGVCVANSKVDFSLCGDAPAGVCDAQDYCLLGECIDNKKDRFFQCNNDLNECDTPDYCTGIDDHCPRTYVIAGAPCGPQVDLQTNPCDAQNQCDGQGVCLEVKQPTTLLCRENNKSGCDIADYCDGIHNNCPDNKLPVGYLCGNSAMGDCDLHNICNDQAQCIDIKKLPGAICDYPNGACSLASTCDGLNNDCPIVPPASAGTPCGPTTAPGICDAQGQCSMDNCTNGVGGPDNDSDGYSTACDCDDTNPLIYPGQVCEVINFGCTQSICNSTSKICDVQIAQAGVACGANSTQACLHNPICDGLGSCNDMNFKSSSTPCRFSAGACDPEEFCTGNSPNCPINILSPQGTSCGSQDAGICATEVGHCNGISSVCGVTSINNPDGDTGISCDTHDNVEECGLGTIYCNSGTPSCLPQDPNCPM